MATDPAGSGHNWPKWPGSDRIQRSPAGIRQFWPDPAKHARRIPATATSRYRIPTTTAFSLFVIFLYESNAEKYFRKNKFF